MSSNTKELTIQDAEELLSTAGITATVVDSCADANCSWCEPQLLALAA